MNRRMKQMLPQLRRLKRMSSRDQKKFLKTCGKDFICCICEVVKNILNGNVPLKKKQLSSLARRKQSLRKLVLKKTPVGIKKKILQKGGFLGALITPILSLLGGWLGNSSSSNGTR
jgi:hypothetical protein